VFARRVVAAADVAADLAHPQVLPAHSLSQALLATGDLGGELEVLDFPDVGAGGRDSTLDDGRGLQSATPFL
jgi:hypothetical protein